MEDSRPRSAVVTAGWRRPVAAGLHYEIQGMESIARRKGSCRDSNRKLDHGHGSREETRRRCVNSSDKWRVTLRQAQGRLSDEQGAADIKPRSLHHRRDCALSLCNLRFNRVGAGCPNELGAGWKYQLQWAGSRAMPAELQALVRTNKAPSPNHLVGLSVVAASNPDPVVPVAHAHMNLAKRSVTHLIRG